MISTKIWMPLYIADYLADTTRLTTMQHGAYLLMIMDYWRNGPLPDDDVALAHIVRMPLAIWKKHRGIVSQMFQIDSGRWHHKRIDAEREAAVSNATKYAERAKNAASKRWAKHRSEECQVDATSNHQVILVECPSPSTSPKSSEPEGSERASVKKGKPLPVGFYPDATGISFANQRGVAVDTELESFRNYHTARGTTMKDWQAAWRTWCGKAVEFRRTSLNSATTTKVTSARRSSHAGFEAIDYHEGINADGTFA